MHRFYTFLIVAVSTSIFIQVSYFLYKKKYFNFLFILIRTACISYWFSIKVRMIALLNYIMFQEHKVLISNLNLLRGSWTSFHQRKKIIYHSFKIYKTINRPTTILFKYNILFNIMILANLGKVHFRKYRPIDRTSYDVIMSFMSHQTLHHRHHFDDFYLIFDVLWVKLYSPRICGLQGDLLLIMYVHTGWPAKYQNCCIS